MTDIDSTLPKEEEIETTSSIVKLEDDEEEDILPPQTTFNGALKHFEYVSKARNVDNTPLRRSKRALATSSVVFKTEPGENHKWIDEDASERLSKRQRLSHSDAMVAPKLKALVASKSVSPAKRKRQKSSGYAAPSTYAHLPPLRDVLEPNLICVFVGVNPGIQTATQGHAYAHPSNLFWKLLHSSGCTDRRCRPDEDGDLPRLYAMGNTNIVERPTRDASELSKKEMAEGTPILEAKVSKYKPEAVCIVGKGIWEAVWRWRYGRNPKKEEFRYGWQDEKENMGVGVKDEKGNPWKGARVFVATTTSGLSAGMRPHEKEAIWKPFGEWVKRRRAERDQRQ